jgi:toxin ParE1/3/4
MRAHFTPQAEIDLEEVGDYIALDNPGRAVSFIREIRQHCEKIAGGLDHYAARPDLGDTIRICAHGNYLIIFEPFDDGALILRVLQSTSIAPKQHFLTLDLTVKLACSGTELPVFRCLRVLDTIEWE